MATERAPKKKAPSDAEKAGYAFPIETVSIPIPEGDSNRHLYEVKMMFTVPAGHSMNDVYAAVAAWVLHGSKGLAEVLVEYGGGLKNKTLMSPAGRKGSSGRGMICTAFENQSIPKKDTTIKVLRKKEDPKKKAVKRGQR